MYNIKLVGNNERISRGEFRVCTCRLERTLLQNRYIVLHHSCIPKQSITVKSLPWVLYVACYLAICTIQWLKIDMCQACCVTVCVQGGWICSKQRCIVEGNVSNVSTVSRSRQLSKRQCCGNRARGHVEGLRDLTDVTYSEEVSYCLRKMPWDNFCFDLVLYK